MIPDEDQEQPVGWLFGEPMRVALINAPLVLLLASAKYTSWIYQERPRQPDQALGFIEAKDFKGIKVYTTPNEAWTSQSLSNLGWFVLLACAVLLCLRAYLKPGTPIIRPPVEGVPYPAEFIATLVVLVSMVIDVFTQKF